MCTGTHLHRKPSIIRFEVMQHIEESCVNFVTSIFLNVSNFMHINKSTHALLKWFVVTTHSHTHS